MANDVPILFVVSGPSGSGKGTFLSHAASCFPEVVRVQTFTTRPPRPNETADDYNFVTLEEFLSKSRTGEIFESTRTYEDHYYGSPSRLIRIDEPADLMVELEVKGMLRLKALSARRVVSIFVMPPTMETLAERIKSRHREDNFASRLEKARDQVSYAYAYDYVLINDRLEPFLDQVETILKAERLRRAMAAEVRDRMGFLLQT